MLDSTTTSATARGEVQRTGGSTSAAGKAVLGPHGVLPVQLVCPPGWVATQPGQKGRPQHKQHPRHQAAAAGGGGTAARAEDDSRTEDEHHQEGWQHHHHDGNSHQHDDGKHHQGSGYHKHGRHHHHLHSDANTDDSSTDEEQPASKKTKHTTKSRKGRQIIKEGQHEEGSEAEAEGTESAAQDVRGVKQKGRRSAASQGKDEASGAGTVASNTENGHHQQQQDEDDKEEDQRERMMALDCEMCITAEVGSTYHDGITGGSMYEQEVHVSLHSWSHSCCQYRFCQTYCSWLSIWSEAS